MTDPVAVQKDATRTADADTSTATSTAAAGITVYQTSPQRLTMHRIEDHELELLVNMSRPVMLALAGVFGGGFLGLLPSAIAAYSHVTAEAVSGSDLASVFICGACFVGVLVCGSIAVQAQKKAASTIDSIRKRVASPVTR